MAAARLAPDELAGTDGQALGGAFYFATPESRCKKFNATRSRASSVLALPRTEAITSPAAALSPLCLHREKLSYISDSSSTPATTCDSRAMKSPLAWLPISLAAFRDSQPSAIFVIFITSVWPIIINTAVGIRNIPQDYRNVAAVVQLNPLEFFSKIMIPAAAPYIFTGLRIGIGLSWLAIVAAEMLIGGVGIGFFIWDAWNSSHISEIILALFYVGIIGFVLDRLIAGMAKVVTRGTALN